MSGSLLLDTNIIIALFAHDEAVQRRLASANEVYVPSIAIGELYYGARKSGRVSANLARIDEFAAKMVVLACDATTAQYYGQVKALLRAKGRPLPENDIWIAATAQQHDLTLLSRDDHFVEVEGLRCEKC